MMPFYRALVVENHDTKHRLRVQVRVLGVHPFNEKDPSTGEENDGALPDSVLPWAQQCIPPNVGRVDGKYGRCDVPEKGDWVWVFFEDEAHQKPWYFGIISTPNDVPSKYRQVTNRFEVDRWHNTLTTDKQKMELSVFSDEKRLDEVCRVTLKKDGNIEIFSKNNPGAVIDLGGGLNRSSAVNFTNMNLWMRAIEEQLTQIWSAMFTHTHLGNMGFPTTPTILEPIISLPLYTSTWQPEMQKIAGDILAVHMMCESAKLQISGFEDGVTVPPKGA